MKTAIIKKVSHGKLKGQYRFLLVAENGEIIAQSYPETYTQKHNAIEVLTDNFPDFEISDQTKEKNEVQDQSTSTQSGD